MLKKLSSAIARPSACLLLATAASYPIHSTADIKVISADEVGDHLQLGQPFDLVTHTPRNYGCVLSELPKAILYPDETSMSLSWDQDLKTRYENMKGRVDASLPMGGFKAEGAIEFQKAIAQSDSDINFHVFASTASVYESILSPFRLSPKCMDYVDEVQNAYVSAGSTEDAAKAAEEIFVNRIGDHFVSGKYSRGLVSVDVKVKFDSESAKKRFGGELSITTAGLSIGGALEKLTREDLFNTSVEVKAYQEGGDPGALASIVPEMGKQCPMAYMITTDEMELLIDKVDLPKSDKNLAANQDVMAKEALLDAAQKELEEADYQLALKRADNKADISVYFKLRETKTLRDSLPEASRAEFDTKYDQYVEDLINFESLTFDSEQYRIQKASIILEEADLEAQKTTRINAIAQIVQERDTHPEGSEQWFNIDNQRKEVQIEVDELNAEIQELNNEKNSLTETIEGYDNGTNGEPGINQLVASIVAFETWLGGLEGANKDEISGLVSDRENLNEVIEEYGPLKETQLAKSEVVKNYDANLYLAQQNAKKTSEISQNKPEKPGLLEIPETEGCDTLIDDVVDYINDFMFKYGANSDEHIANANTYAYELRPISNTIFNVEDDGFYQDEYEEALYQKYRTPTYDPAHSEVVMSEIRRSKERLTNDYTHYQNLYEESKLLLREGAEFMDDETFDSLSLFSVSARKNAYLALSNIQYCSEDPFARREDSQSNSTIGWECIERRTDALNLISPLASATTAEQIESNKNRYIDLDDASFNEIYNTNRSGDNVKSVNIPDAFIHQASVSYVSGSADKNGYAIQLDWLIENVGKCHLDLVTEELGIRKLHATYPIHHKGEDSGTIELEVPHHIHSQDLEIAMSCKAFYPQLAENGTDISVMPYQVSHESVLDIPYEGTTTECRPYFYLEDETNTPHYIKRHNETYYFEDQLVTSSVCEQYGEATVIARIDNLNFAAESISSTEAILDISYQIESDLNTQCQLSIDQSTGSSSNVQLLNKQTAVPGKVTEHVAFVHSATADGIRAIKSVPDQNLGLTQGNAQLTVNLECVNDAWGDDLDTIILLTNEIELMREKSIEQCDQTSTGIEQRKYTYRVGANEADAKTVVETACLNYGKDPDLSVCEIQEQSDGTMKIKKGYAIYAPMTGDISGYEQCQSRSDDAQIVPSMIVAHDDENTIHVNIESQGLSSCTYQYGSETGALSMDTNGTKTKTLARSFKTILIPYEIDIPLKVDQEFVVTCELDSNGQPITQKLKL